MRRFVIIVILFLPHPALAISAEAYQNCAALSKPAPEEALRRADAWLREAYTPEAEHCRALALFTLKRYEDAAQTLEHVFTQTPPEDVLLSVNLLRQTGRAWAKTPQTDSAKARYGQAISILHGVRKPTALTQRLLAETLLERGEFQAKAGEPYDALQDMDQAVSLNLLGERALLSRARLLLSMEQPELARADVETMLRLNPQSAPAQKLLAEIVSHPAKK